MSCVLFYLKRENLYSLMRVFYAVARTLIIVVLSVAYHGMDPSAVPEQGLMIPVTIDFGISPPCSRSSMPTAQHSIIAAPL